MIASRDMIEIIDVDVHGLFGQSNEQWLDRACEIAGRDFTELS